MSKAQLVYLAHPLAGERADYGRMAGGAISNYYRVSATGIVLAQPCLLYGIYVLTAGSAGTFQAYDGVSALAGAEISTSVAFGSLPVGPFSLGQPGVALELTTGLFLTVPTGAVIRVDVVPLVPGN